MYERRTPKPGLEKLAYATLRAAGCSLDYREIARRVDEARGTEPDPVVLQNVLRSAPDLFLDCGQSRFRAISSVMDFEAETDNIWYRLPPFSDATVDRSFVDARRVRLGQFAAEMNLESTVGDVLRAIPGTRWRELPDARAIGLARSNLTSDRLARGGLDLVEQWARREPKPSLDDLIDRESLVRAGGAARQRMIESNLRLVGNIARSMVGRGVEYVDLCQYGVLGLIRGVEKFDPDLGWKFSTYATWWVRQAMTRAAADEGRLIRVPVHRYEKSPWLVREHIPHHIPDDELASLRPIVSLERIPEEALPSADPTADPEDGFVREQVQSALARLEIRDREVLEKRFGLKDGRRRTLESVAGDYNLTRERIRQIEAKAIKRLRHPSRKLRVLLEDPDAAQRRRTQPRASGSPMVRLSVSERQVLGLLYLVEQTDRPSHAEVAKALGLEANDVFELEQDALRRMSNGLRVALSAWRYGAPGTAMSKRVAGILERAVRTGQQDETGEVSADLSGGSPPSDVSDGEPSPPSPLGSPIHLTDDEFLTLLRAYVRRELPGTRQLLIARFGLEKASLLSTAEVAVKYDQSLVLTRWFIAHALDDIDMRLRFWLIARDPTLAADLNSA